MKSNRFATMMCFDQRRSTRNRIESKKFSRAHNPEHNQMDQSQKRVLAMTLNRRTKPFDERTMSVTESNTKSVCITCDKVSTKSIAFNSH